MIQDIDYEAQVMLSNGIMPGAYYDSSYSEMQSALEAKSREDRVQDPVEMARKAELL